MTGRVTLRLTRTYRLMFTQETSICGRDERSLEIFSSHDDFLRCGTRVLLTTKRVERSLSLVESVLFLHFLELMGKTQRTHSVFGERSSFVCSADRKL